MQQISHYPLLQAGCRACGYPNPSSATAMAGRAAAATGQSGLMALYDSLFGMMDLQAAQVLVTLSRSLGTAAVA